jgi:AraC-like DNA-binding protein
MSPDAARVPYHRTVLEATGAEPVLRLLAEVRGVLRVRGCDGHSTIRMTRDRLGPVRVERSTVRMDLEADAAPADELVFGRVHAGRVGFRTGDQERWHGPGQHYLAAAPGTPRTSMVQGGDHEQFILDPELLTTVANTAPNREPNGRIRFLAFEPLPGKPAMAWASTCDYISSVTGENPGGLLDQPLLAGRTARLLAAAALTAFPNTALLDPTISDRRDAHPATLRRAIAFIDENAHLDISPADIAAAASVTIRALQLTFRRHLDTTPGAYVRRVRLEHIHRDLLTADPATTTVAAVALRWGLRNHSRFTADYRASYGTAPSATLRGD